MRERAPAKKPDHPLTIADLGIVMLPNTLDRTPTFVDSVRAGSPAAAAGIQPDDLIVYVGEQIVHTYSNLATELCHLDRDTEVHLRFMRDGVLKEAVLKPSAE